MTDSLNHLTAATVVFVASHFLLSSLALRRQLMRSVRERGFRVVYSLVALVTFVWMLRAYGAAPYVEVWTPPLWTAWVPILVMPIALILAVAGLTVANPTAVGGEARLAASDPGDPAPGILRITRHPFLWSVVLWALAHLACNGDGATMILLVGLLVLAAGGMVHIDRRRAETLGAAWGPLAMTTSLMPFGAIPDRSDDHGLAGSGLVAAGRRLGTLRPAAGPPRRPVRRAGVDVVI